MSRDRETLKQGFLAQAGLAGVDRRPIPGDASTRRYERLATPGGARLLLVDAPPSEETQPCPPDADAAARQAAGYNALARLAAGRVDAFAACAGFLRDLGLSAPEVVALDADAGLALVEDLGDGIYARMIETSQADERELYLTAVEALARLHDTAPPEVLEGSGARWPLLTYDALALATGADLFVQWMPQLDPRLQFGPDAVAEWQALWQPWLDRAEAGATVFTHRDYHAENLLWLDDRQTTARVGMIDFQDAVRAHPSWDLHSLLQDARRDVPAEIESQALEHYFALRPQVDRHAFMADYGAMAALNEARILGIFARLIVRDGKPRYRAFMPRMWDHLARNLMRPEMAPLRGWFDRHVPFETRR